MSICLSVCMYVSKILWTLYLKNECAEIDETLYAVALWSNLVPIKFCCISLKKFRCCSKFLTSLTQWYGRKLCAILPSTKYLKSIILKLKYIFILAIVRFCVIFAYIGAMLAGGGEGNPLVGDISYRWYFLKKHLKIRKTNGEIT